MPIWAASAQVARSDVAPRTRWPLWRQSPSLMRATPLRVKLSPVSGFKLKAIAEWAKKGLAAGSTVYSDGLACFGAVTQAGCTHEYTVVAGRKPNDVPQLQWINTVLGNLKTSLSGSYHSFDFRKYAAQYLGTSEPVNDFATPRMKYLLCRVGSW